MHASAGYIIVWPMRMAVQRFAELGSRRGPAPCEVSNILAGPGTGFYSGKVAAAIAEAVQSRQGVLTEDDLAAHQTAVVPPISTVYKGHRVYEVPPPTQARSPEPLLTASCCLSQLCRRDRVSLSLSLKHLWQRETSVASVTQRLNTQGQGCRRTLTRTPETDMARPPAHARAFRLQCLLPNQAPLPLSSAHLMSTWTRRALQRCWR